jgi:hypothetical protein
MIGFKQIEFFDHTTRSNRSKVSCGREANCPHGKRIAPRRSARFRRSCWNRAIFFAYRPVAGAEAAGSSFALNLAFGLPGGFWAVLAPILTSLLVMNPKWREPPPPVTHNQLESQALPENLASFFTSRVDELIEMLQSLRDEPEALRQAWLRALANEGVSPTPGGSK